MFSKLALRNVRRSFRDYGVYLLTLTSVSYTHLMDLAGSGVPLYAMAWGLAALAAGAFRGKKRVWAAAAFAAADGAAVLWTWDRGLPLAILYEVFLGSVAFFMVPERQWKRLGGLLAPAQTAPPDGRAQGYVQKKLEATAAAFRTLYESLRGSFRVPENDNDVAAVFDRAACREMCIRDR